MTKCKPKAGKECVVLIGSYDFDGCVHGVVYPVGKGRSYDTCFWLDVTNRESMLAWNHDFPETQQTVYFTKKPGWLEVGNLVVLRATDRWALQQKTNVIWEAVEEFNK